MTDLADTWVRGHCTPCAGNGMRLGTGGLLEICPACGGDGWRLLQPLEAAALPQSKAGPETPGEELEWSVVSRAAEG